MSYPDALLDRNVLFFGGKGGVGKTTLAAAFAVRAAGAGRRTLLVSTDPAHSVSDIFETEVGDEPRPVLADCWALEIDPERETNRYIADVKQRIADATAPRLAAEVERQIDVARVSPGAAEAAVFERFTRIIEEARASFDCVVFDTAPTGQTLRLLSLPELMSAWIGGLISQRKKVNVLSRMWRNVAGAAAGDAPGVGDPVLAALEERKARFHRARHVLTDSDRTAFIFVMVPERLPSSETERAVLVLAKYGIPIGAVLVNRLIPTTAEGSFVGRRREREAEYLERINRILGRYQVYHVLLADGDVVGVEALRRLIATPAAQ
jgi:arsenite-transporting ATPase